MSSSFFEVFRFLSNLDRSQFLGAGRNFRTSIGSFRFTSSWDSEVILLSQRLALKYNTIRRAGCQHFFASFFRFFRADSNPLHPLGFFRQSLLSSIMYYIKEYSRGGVGWGGLGVGGGVGGAAVVIKLVEGG